MDNILDRHGGAGLAHEAVGFVEDIRRVENGRKRLPTWPRNRTEARISRNTMGYYPRPRSLYASPAPRSSPEPSS